MQGYEPLVTYFELSVQTNAERQALSENCRLKWKSMDCEIDIALIQQFEGL